MRGIVQGDALTMFIEGFMLTAMTYWITVE